MRRQYYIILALATLIPLLTLAIISFLFVPLQQDGIAHRRLTAAFGGFSKYLDRCGLELLSRTNAMATSSSLYDHLLTYNQIGYFDQPAFIEQSVRQLSMANLDYLMVTDHQGFVISQGHEPGIFGGTATDDPLIIRALAGQKIYSTGLRRIRGRWEALILASVPVMFRNRIIGTLTAGVIIDENMLESAKNLSGAEYILVVGGTAKISTVDKEMDQQILFVQGESMQSYNIGGQKYRFTSFPLVDFAGANVADMILGVNIAEIETISGNFARLFALLFVAAAILSIMATKYYSTKVERQMAMLADGLSRMASGELSATVSVNPRDELRNLSLQLNATAAELKDKFYHAVESERSATLTLMADKIGARIKKTAEIIRDSLEQLNRKIAETPSVQSSVSKEIQRLMAEVNSIERLGTTLFGFTGLSAPQMAPITLDQIGQLIEKEYREEIDSGNLLMTVEDNRAKIMADPVQLKNLLDYLIQNSFEAAGYSGKVEMKVGVEGDRAYLTILDNGPGFSELAMKNLFQPFFSTKQGANGLGLTMAKIIIANHDGEIEIGNNPSGGAIVRVTFDILPDES